MSDITLAAMLGGWEVLFLLVVFLLLPLAAVVVGLALFFALRSRHKQPPPATHLTGWPGRERHCPQCGAQLKPDAPEGLCPACLLRHGVATESGAPPGRPPFVPPDPIELARLFPQLEILELIGAGGMGAVYKARQPALDRVVALKILAPRASEDLDFAGRFTREARALARLSHPNIVAVYDFGQTSGLHYFIMEYVEGPNLRQVEQAGRLAPREALQIVPQICAALQFAHDEGIVHRDIKPENVLLDKKGRVKIADFGLAKILRQESKESRLTGAKDVMGTPHYMAPEQMETPQEVDHRADIYSLGVVFYEMLTGELPLGKFQPPSRKVQVDVRLDEVVLRALAREPELRYQQASEVKTDVETIATSEGGISGATGRSPAFAQPQDAGAGGSSGHRQPSVSRSVLDSAKRQVKAPAIGLIATGVVEWVIVSFIAIGMTWYYRSGVQMKGANQATGTAYLPFIAVLFLAMLLAGFLVYAGLKLQRLEGWSNGVIAAILAIVIAPANLLGLPIGIWTLVVLSRREVRDAFESLPSAGPSEPWLSLVGKREGRRILRWEMVAVTLLQVGVIAGALWAVGVGGAILGGAILLMLTLVILAFVRGFAVPVEQLPEAKSAASRNAVRLGWWRFFALAALTALALGLGPRAVFGPAEPNVMVSGVVTDAATGDPIAGARVDDNRYGANRIPQQAWTDAHGHFELKTWYEEHNIAVSAPGYETVLTNLMTKLFGSEREVRMDFRLQPAKAADSSAPEGD